MTRMSAAGRCRAGLTGPGVHAAIMVLALWAGSACRSAAPGAGAAADSPGPGSAFVAGGSGSVVAAEAPTPAPERPSKADEPNTTHGIYTEEQAARGLVAFKDICSECHETKDWTDPAFLERWEEVSVYRLWYWIYERMPHGQPGSLTRQQVTDALTYILQLNGLPPGENELASDDDSIDDYWIIWKVQ